MTGKTFSLHVPPATLLLLVIMIAAASLGMASPADYTGHAASAAGSMQQPAVDVRATWSGIFFSKHSNVTPFTMTVVISANSSGHLVGNSTLNSECLKGAQLEVTVTGSNVLVAGSDEEGDSLTVRGTVDNTGALLKASYIMNGSATGRCETDNGTGNLAKR